MTNVREAAGGPLLNPSAPLSPSQPPSPSVSRNVRFAYALQALFAFVCIVIFIDFFISRSTFARTSRIQRAICPDPQPNRALGVLNPAGSNNSVNPALPSKVTVGGTENFSSSETAADIPSASNSTLISPPKASVLKDKKQVATFVITCGTAETDAVSEMSALLKSVLAFASEPVRLIFVTDSNGAQRLRKLFAEDLVRSKRQLWVDIHLLHDSIVNEWAAKIRLDPVGHHSGRWGTAKLMLPWIFKDIDRIVVLDTDMVFVEDPIRLWELFEDGGKDWIYQMPVSNKASPTTMCSCIVLIKMDLAREKNVFPTLFHESLKSGPKKWWIANRRIWRPVTGDQGLYWLMMRKYPAYFRLLPSNWDKDHCHGFYGSLKANSKDRVSLLHRNCAGQNSAIVKDQASPFFDFFLHYRWHWLTPQSGKSFAVQVRNFTVGKVV